MPMVLSCQTGIVYRIEIFIQNTLCQIWEPLIHCFPGYSYRIICMYFKILQFRFFLAYQLLKVQMIILEHPVDIHIYIQVCKKWFLTVSNVA